MGTIYKGKGADGLHRVKGDVWDTRLKRHVSKTFMARTRAAAESVAAKWCQGEKERLSLAAVHGHNPGGDRTVKAAAGEYLSDTKFSKPPKSKKHKGSKYQRELQLSRWWKHTSIGSMKLREVTPQLVDELFYEILLKRCPGAQGWSDGYKRHHLSALSAVFGYAVKRLWLETNPVRGVMKPSKSKDRIRYLNQHEPDEEARLFAELAKNPGLYEWAVVTLATGCRMSESAGARKEDFHALAEEAGILRVRGKGANGEPRWRNVPVGGEAFQILKKLKAKGSGTGYFWPSRGNPDSYRSFGQQFCEATRRAGLTGITPHTLRHSFATRALLAGLDWGVLALILGHSDPRTTKIYAHVANELLIKVAGQLHEQRFRAPEIPQQLLLAPSSHSHVA